LVGGRGPRRSHPEGYQAAVRAGLDAIAAGEVSKVVLARDLVGTVPAGADLRRLVRSLATGYPDTWVYAVDGLIGASPETLVTVAGGTVTARVLAGRSLAAPTPIRITRPPGLWHPVSKTSPSTASRSAVSSTRSRR
jgi:isochorismate synthase EntC